jgi:hypothetical protein
VAGQLDRPGQVVQQHGLAHTLVTVHHQGLALAGLDGVDEPVQQVAFAAPVVSPAVSRRVIAPPP